MSPFLKKKVVKQKAEEFSEADQTPKEESKACECENCQHFGKVFANQQLIYNELKKTQQLMLQLAGEPPVEEKPVEPTPEELRAAWEEKQGIRRPA